MSLMDYRNIMRESTFGRMPLDDSNPISMVIIMNDGLQGAFPGHTLGDSYLAAGEAMMGLLSSLAAMDGVYHDNLVEWSNNRIRKVVKHAKPSRFDRVARELRDHGCPFATLGAYSAQAMVIAPLPESEQRTAEWFHTVHGLQLDGYRVMEGESSHDDDVMSAMRTSSGHDITLPRRMAYSLCSSVDSSLGMSAGKSIAQYLHSVQVGIGRLSDGDFDTWMRYGATISCDDGEPSTDATVVIHDAGFTEIPSGSLTASADFITPL